MSLKEFHKMWGIFKSAEFFSRRVVDRAVVGILDGCLMLSAQLLPGHLTASNAVRPTRAAWPPYCL